MKKSVFTLLAIATMVVSMSSCSQNDGGSSNDLNLTQTTQAQPKEQQNLSFVVCATPQQLATLDMQFVVEVNGQEKTLNAAQMTESNDTESAIVTSMKQLNDAFDEVGSKTEMKVMTVNLGQYTSAKCHVKAVKWSVKEGYADGPDVNVMCAYGFSTGKNTFCNSTTDAEIYKSVQGDKESLTQFCNIMNEQTGNDLNF